MHIPLKVIWHMVRDQSPKKQGCKDDISPFLVCNTRCFIAHKASRQDPQSQQKQMTLSVKTKGRIVFFKQIQPEYRKQKQDGCQDIAQ